MKNNAIIFALTANVEMAKEISKELGIPLGQSEVVHFADGEIIVENATTVRGKNVYIIQSTCNAVRVRLMELLVFIDGGNHKRFHNSKYAYLIYDENTHLFSCELRK